MNKTPLAYFGGKFYMLKILLPILENIQHSKFVDVCGGSGVVILNKKPQGIEIYNDVDGEIVNFFKVISDPEKFKKFYRFIVVLPSSRQIYYDYLKEYKNEEDNIVRAVKWFYVARQSFSGIFGNSWSFTNNLDRGNISGSVSRWLGAINKLPDIQQRLQQIQYENKDFREIFKIYDSEDALFYVDPPYIHDTRSDGKYIFEMTDQDHIDLVSIILKTKGSVVLSGYHHEIYQPLIDNGWEVETAKSIAFSVARTKSMRDANTRDEISEKQKRIEYIYISPNAKKREIQPSLGI